MGFQLDWDLSSPQEQWGLSYLPTAHFRQDQGLIQTHGEARREEQKPKAIYGPEKCVKTVICCLHHGSCVLGGAKSTASVVRPSAFPPTSWVTQDK